MLIVKLINGSKYLICTFEKTCDIERLFARAIVKNIIIHLSVVVVFRESFC